jgi:rhomboid protease GluP
MTTPTPETPASTPPNEVHVPVVLRTSVKKPWVTYIILAVTILMYGVQYLTQKMTGYDLPFLYGVKANDYILAGEIWRLITPVLLHGSLIHLAFNMYALYSIGTSLERFYGHKRFLWLYLIAGFTGNVLSFLLTASPSLGASTAIFGLVAAEGVLIFRNKRIYGNRARSLLLNLGLVLVVNLSFGLTPGSNIDNWGHLGGLAGGLIFAWVAGPIYKFQTNLMGGFDLVDSSTTEKTWWGFLLSAGLFTAAVIGKFIVGK